MDETNIELPEQAAEKPAAPAPVKKPNELGGFNISGVVKIYDPNTNETFVEVRA